MAKKNYAGLTAAEKEFVKLFNEVSYRHNPWTVWGDFVSMTADAIANAVDHDAARWGNREQDYLARAKKYDKDELNKIAQLFALTTEALEENPSQDFLGNLYMNLDFGSSWSGQFFTPWHVAEMMARMTIDDKADADLAKQGYISVADPCCGAGCMLLAFADVCRKVKKINYQERVLFVGQDIDRVVAQMCYIQLSLLGCAGYVVAGNSLTQPIAGRALSPVIDRECEVWYTPMWFSDLWTVRQISANIAKLFG